MKMHDKEKHFAELARENFEYYGEFQKSDEDLIYEMAQLFIEFYYQFSDPHHIQIERVQEMLRMFTCEKYDLYKIIGDVRVSLEVQNTKDESIFKKEYKNGISKAIDDILSKYDSNIDKNDLNKKDKEEYINLKTLNAKKPLGFSINELYSNSSNNGSIKPSKMFSKVFGPDSIATTTYSNIIQNNTIKETAYISISPLDYLTMSENSYNWQSCLRLGGEYSAGALSYIQDPTTIVTFIGKYNNGFCALDKRWRQLMYVGSHKTDLYISQSRQYPSKMDTVQNAIRRKMESLVNKLVGENLTYTKTRATKAFNSIGYAPHYYDLNGNHYGVETYHKDIGKKLKDFTTVGAESFCLGCDSEITQGEENYGFVCYSCYH